MLRRIMVLALTLVLLLTSMPAVTAAPADYDIANGHFFTQTGGGAGKGFMVVDGGQDKSGNPIRFWSEFRGLGGVTTLGYPISRRYLGPGGFVYQAFQRGVLQWRHESNRAMLSNTFEWLQAGGKDAWLTASKGVPPPIADDGSGGDYAKAVETRLSWLTEPAIAGRYLANPNPDAIPNWSRDRAIELYGLPMSKPAQSGPFVTQRFQRVALQLWTEDVPGMPARGSVVGVLGGDLVKEAGLIQADATTPGADNEPLDSVPAAPTAPPQPTPVPAGSYSWHPVMRQWSSNCGTTFVHGHAVNRSGGLQNGIAIKTWNDWGNVVISGTGTDANRGTGAWVRIVNSAQNPQTWYAAVVDGNGNQASEVFTIKFESDCSRGAQVVELDFVEN